MTGFGLPLSRPERDTGDRSRRVREFGDVEDRGRAAAARRSARPSASDPRSGSLFELGEWVRLPRPVPNPTLSEQLRNYRGSGSMFVRCRWELDSPVDLVPAGTELRGFEQRARLLEALTGSRIVTAAFSAEPPEFLLSFDSKIDDGSDPAGGRESPA